LLVSFFLITQASIRWSISDSSLRSIFHLTYLHDFKYDYTSMTHKLISPIQTSPLNSNIDIHLCSPSPFGFLHGICLDLLSTAITKYLRLGNLQRK
jgi:hypothetical protein